MKLNKITAQSFIARLQVILLLVLCGAMISSNAIAKDFSVEDPHICQTVTTQYSPLREGEANSDQEHLIKAVLFHCQDDFPRSIAVVDELLRSPQSLSASELTYAHILQSVSLSNVEDIRACDMAKLSVAFANSGASRALGIRAELGFYSFCNITDENLAHALQRLYELSKEAIALDIPHLELAIHNQISYVYYNIDQNQLAADELEAAYSISQEINADDLTITLFNLIDAYLDAGQLDSAAQRIEVLAKALDDESSDFDKWLLYYAKSHHALLSKDHLRVISYFDYFESIDKTDSHGLNEKLASVQGLACFASKQYDCVSALMQQHFSAIEIAKETSLNILKLIIQWSHHQGNNELMGQAQQRYFDLAEQKLVTQQQAAKILGVAKLNNEVIQLNAYNIQKQLIHQSELNKISTIVIAMASIFILFLLIYLYRLRAKNKPRNLFS